MENSWMLQMRMNKNVVLCGVTITNTIDINKRFQEVEFRLSVTFRINSAPFISLNIKLNKLF